MHYIQCISDIFKEFSLAHTILFGAFLTFSRNCVVYIWWHAVWWLMQLEMEYNLVIFGLVWFGLVKYTVVKLIVNSDVVKVGAVQFGGEFGLVKCTFVWFSLVKTCSLVFLGTVHFGALQFTHCGIKYRHLDAFMNVILMHR